MTKDQIEQKIAELHKRCLRYKKEIGEVEREAVKIEDKKEWTKWLNIGCEYWIVTSSGEPEISHWSDDYCDNLRVSIGNTFRTEQDAIFALERLKVLAEMRKFAFEPDYASNEKKWFIFYDEVDKIVKPDFTYHSRMGITMFRGVVDAEVCIAKIGEERLKKYYFGVKDDS